MILQTDHNFLYRHQLFQEFVVPGIRNKTNTSNWFFNTSSLPQGTVIDTL